MRFGLLLITISAIGLEAGQQAPPPPPYPSISERAQKADIPTLEAEPTDPEQKNIRDARSRIFKNGGRPLSLATKENLHSLMIADMRSLHELPTSEEGADLVLYGKVIRSQVFANGRKTGLYTDYTVKVGRTLKPLDQHAEGTEVSVLRIGGLARSPSGAVIEDEVSGYGPEPAIGSQYLFFLVRLPDPANAYTYLKFWNVVPQEDGTSIVKAASDQDLARVKKGKSVVDGKSLEAVSSMLQGR